MNGRVYDPVLGRMLSPDNFVQDATGTQGYNRYSYAANNPLRYVDPSGQFIEYILAGAILLGKFYYDGYKANDNEPNPFKWDWGNATYTVGYSNTGGNSSYSTGVGWGNNYSTNVGYNSSNNSATFGYSYNGSTYNQSINTPEQSSGYIDWRNVDEARDNMQNTYTGQEGFNNEEITSQFSQFGEITREKGGFIDNYNDFYIFMVNKAANEVVEVAAFGVQDANGTKYYVQPWEYNTPTNSVNNAYGIPGYSREDIFAQYHTHKNSYGPSRFDAIFTQNWNIPVYSIGADGRIWITDYYPKGYLIPRYTEGMPYGKLIKR
ncbi:MAG: hypothetical protein A3G23_11570 [Bacteroidetes bacterium RIFCSPLOWO2_12_FULL_37_12]|nr:MAG: hypothetical protein A3G23_11570 [Bacteroidetes bacterium RIFCSPLOWO2_12_FULL_37_12]